MTQLYLLGSVLSYINVKIFMYIGPSYLLREVEAWGNFISISLILSALFVVNKRFKTCFCTFPNVFNLASIVWDYVFAIIPTSYAIKGILELIMQAGAVLVTLLLFGVNTYLYGWKWTYIAIHNRFHISIYLSTITHKYPFMSCIFLQYIILCWNDIFNI